MRATEGDSLLAASGMTALILKVLGANGCPPYVVRWQPSGHITMVTPEPYSRVIPAHRTCPADRDGPGEVK